MRANPLMTVETKTVCLISVIIAEKQKSIRPCRRVWRWLASPNTCVLLVAVGAVAGAIFIGRCTIYPVSGITMRGFSIGPCIGKTASQKHQGYQPYEYCLHFVHRLMLLPGHKCRSFVTLGFIFSGSFVCISNSLTYGTCRIHHIRCRANFYNPTA